jgi:hypothetical protein
MLHLVSWLNTNTDIFPAAIVPPGFTNKQMESNMITAKDIREFNSYLRACSDAQVRGVYEKEKQAGRHEYMTLAEMEAQRRGLFWMDWESE